MLRDAKLAIISIFVQNREQDYNDDKFFAAGVAQIPGIYDKVRNL